MLFIFYSGDFALCTVPHEYSLEFTLHVQAYQFMCAMQLGVASLPGSPHLSSFSVVQAMEN